jgi:hypothetical protein
MGFPTITVLGLTLATILSLPRGHTAASNNQPALILFTTWGLHSVHVTKHRM